MIIPAANLLLYAYDEASAFHLRAKAWWSTCLSGRSRSGRSPWSSSPSCESAPAPRCSRLPFFISEAADHVKR